MNDKPIITFLGQSGFLLEYDNVGLLLDPANKKSGNYDGELVYCTHNHFDHVGGVDVFMERNESALLICGEQTASKFVKWGDRVKSVNDGESFTHGPFTLQFKYLRHGLFKGKQNLGVVISTENFSFAHCGDAADFQGFPMNPVDVLAIPIVGGFTSGPGKSAKMVMNLEDPKPVIVPMHWLFRNPTKFCSKLLKQMPDIKCVVPVVGESLKL